MGKFLSRCLAHGADQHMLRLIHFHQCIKVVGDFIQGLPGDFTAETAGVGLLSCCSTGGRYFCNGPRMLAGGCLGDFRILLRGPGRNRKGCQKHQTQQQRSQSFHFLFPSFYRQFLVSVS